MKIIIKFFLTLFFGIIVNLLNAQSQNRNISWYSPFYIPPNEIQLSIVFEGIIDTEDGEVNSYAISWEDTVGVKQGYPNYNRPFELKVIVRDRDTIIGSYTGSSTQMTSCNFLTNSKQASVHFWVNKNKFYIDNKKQPSIPRTDTIHNVIFLPQIKTVDIELMHLNYYGEYETLKVNLKKVNQNIIDDYDKKSIILNRNPNIVALNYINKGAMNPNNMPTLGPGYKQIIALNRYQLNFKTGKIRKGKSWIFLKGVRKCCELEFGIIDPYLVYEDKTGKEFTGKMLIRKGKINLEDFNLDFQFKDITRSLPY